MKYALILGASSDIARACSYIFASRNYGIILAGRNLRELELYGMDLSVRYGAETESIEFDALDFHSHRKFYESLPHKPDIVLAATGYLGNQKEAESSEEERQKITGTNFTGMASILSIVASDFEARKEGVIIGISSVAGERGRRTNYFYGSSKAGFTAFLSGLRSRLSASGVRVLTVKPGYVRTKMTEGTRLPGLLTSSAQEAAEYIIKAVDKKKDQIYIKKRWGLIMMITRLIPERIFKLLPF